MQDINFVWISEHPSYDIHSPESTPVDEVSLEVEESEDVLPDDDPSEVVVVVVVVHPTVTPSGEVVEEEEEEDASESDPVDGSSKSRG